MNDQDTNTRAPLEVTVRAIKNRWTGADIWTGDASSMKDAVVKACAAGVSLYQADLSYVDLRDIRIVGATFDGATFDGARFDGATFVGATFVGATFVGARFDGATFDGATFVGARFVGATFDGARFDGATFVGATFVGATFVGARFDPTTVIETGETWLAYLTEVVPALLTAGGKALDSFTAHFDCHTWENCPMAYAFDGKRLTDVPILLRPRAQQFIRYFDAKMIPWPLPIATPAAPSEASTL